MKKTQSTKTKKAVDVRETQKISSFFKKIESKSDDFQTTSNSSVSLSFNGNTKPEVNDKNKNPAQKNININLNASDEDFVSSHLEKFKSKHKVLYKEKSINDESKSRIQNSKKVSENGKKENRKEKLIVNIKRNMNKIPQDNSKNNSQKRDPNEKYNTAEDELLKELNLEENMKPKKIELNKINKSIFQDAKSEIKNVESVTTKYYTLNNQPTSSKNVDVLDDSCLIINFDSNSPKPAKFTPTQLITDCTPEKSYLKRDEILLDVTNFEKENKIDKLLKDVNFIKSVREKSPPHSTPIFKTKKRKSPDFGDFPDIIPPTPDEEMLSKPRKSIERKFSKTSINLLEKIEEYVVPDMIVNSPPRKIQRVSTSPKKIINLSELTQEEFKKIHSTSFKEPVKEYVSIFDDQIIENDNSIIKVDDSVKSSLKTSDFVVESIQNSLSPPKEQLEQIKTLVSLPEPIRTKEPPRKHLSGPITSVTPPSSSKEPMKTIPSLPKQMKSVPTPLKCLNESIEIQNKINEPIKKEISGIQRIIMDYASDRSSEIFATPKSFPKTPTKSPKMFSPAKSTSQFFVSPAKNISPSKWSPIRGKSLNSPISPSKSNRNYRSPCKKNLEFSKDQPRIDTFFNKSPAKSTDTLMDYFKNLPSSCEEKRQTKLETSHFIVTRKSPKKSPQKDEIYNDLNFDDSWDTNISIEMPQNNLNLDDWQYCKVIEVKSDLYQNIILEIASLKTEEKTSCILQGIWRNTKLKSGDKINITASQTNDNIPYSVNNDAGFVVYEPDFLISGTSIVGSLFCKRRGVLSDKFRGVDPGNQAMVVGSLVHRLLQEVLKKNLSKISEVEKLLVDILDGKDIIHSSYSSQVPIEIMKQQTLPYIPRIVEFVGNYVKRDCNANNKNNQNWNGTIESIQDIEENIWCHTLGIKGKVDVTVKTNRQNIFKNNKPTAFNVFAKEEKNTKILPLELKTGKASMSIEHRGQVILYTMIMTELGYKVDSGLLLYLRDGVLKEVESRHKEMRDLIMLRNELAYYLKQQPKVQNDIEIPDNKSDRSKISSKMSVMSDEHPNRQLMFGELPEPINHHSACKKCPYSTICTAFLSRDENYKLSESHPLFPISQEVLSCLQKTHIDYIIHWSSLIHLESTYKNSVKELKDIWRVSPIQREIIGKSLSHLTISEPICDKTEPFIHHFKRANNETTIKIQEKFKKDFLASGLTVGAYTVVSTDTRIAIAAGFVSKLTKDEIAVGLERNLTERYANKVFHIDTYESQTIFNYNMTSVGTLLDDTPKAKRLRELIIDQAQPEFASKLSRSVAVAGKSILQRLNKIQQRAVLKALTAQDYLLIKGMPGTGKTATIVALIQLLVELKKTVLITSHTNSAVDNVCLRLLDCGVDFLRIGSETRVHPLLKHCMINAKTSHCKTVDDLERVYDNSQVIAVTCLGAVHPMLNRRILDVCIVDESTQVLQCSVFRALRSTKSFILIGDPDQLPPVVSNPEAISRGMNESLFERLDSPHSTITLTLQYRMNKIITALANSITYKGQLLCADDSIGYAVLRLPKMERLQSLYNQEQWILNILDIKIGNSVMGIDTGATWKKLVDEGRRNLLEDVQAPVQNVQEDEERICENIYEAGIIFTVVEALKEGGLTNDAIGVIAPYRAQVALLKKVLTKLNKNEQNCEPVEVNTVDQYQGRDKDVIIYSCTRSRDTSKTKRKSNFEILEDKRRLTVAITRAKHKLIIIGDFATLRDYTPFELLMNSIDSSQVFSVAYNTYGFSWEKIMNRIKEYDS